VLDLPYNLNPAPYILNHLYLEVRIREAIHVIWLAVRIDPHTHTHTHKHTHTHTHTHAHTHTQHYVYIVLYT